MGTRWDVQSHEDIHSEGIPDLSYGVDGVNGWIELKQIKQWPVMEKTTVKPEHYTAQQVNWLRRRGKKGGFCYILVKVGKDDYFLFSWQEARLLKNGITKEDYFLDCIKHWSKNIDTKELLHCLTDRFFTLDHIVD
jgi:hypothetical protein